MVDSNGDATAMYMASQQRSDIMREMEAMRWVFMQEQHRLKELVLDAECDVAQMREQIQVVVPRRQESANNTLPEASAPERQVQWRIVNAAAMLAHHMDAPDSTACEKRCFRLVEFPRVDFTLSFYPSGGTPQPPELTRGGSIAPLPCRLILEVTGEVTQGLDLAVDLSLAVEEERPEGSPVVSPSRSSPLAISPLSVSPVRTGKYASYDSSFCTCSPGTRSVVSSATNGRHSPRGVASTSALLRGGGKVICDGLWPADAQVTAVLCRTTVALRSWDSEVLRFDTDWRAPTVPDAPSA